MLTQTANRPIKSGVQRPELPIAIVEDLAVSAAPFVNGADGVIWQRDMPEHVSTWLDHLPLTALPEDRVVLKAADVASCLIELFEAKGVAHHTALSWLSQDVSRLAQWVDETVRTPFLRMRLEIVTNNACSKFHIDNVMARLICTYRGPGTQLNTASAPDEACLSISTGDPVLLKGKRWPQSADSPLRHRSPAIAGTGLTRWLLVLEGCDRSEWMPDYDRTYRDLNLQELI